MSPWCCGVYAAPETCLIPCLARPLVKPLFVPTKYAALSLCTQFLDREKFADICPLASMRGLTSATN